MAYEAPWDDCKVAFGVEDDEIVWEFLEQGTGKWAKQLPADWALVETDGTGARYVAVFRVEGLPTTEDGQRVAKLLRDLNKRAVAKERRAARNR